ncbi:hypothetical protein CLF_108708 [Clonorchis sinensis]|nr:hypothetical protein CLF_108708 [Clonorchis sinensis]
MNITTKNVILHRPLRGIINRVALVAAYNKAAPPNENIIQLSQHKPKSFAFYPAIAYHVIALYLFLM